MLLIAQPKSASTSLANTISLIGNLHCKLGIKKDSIDVASEGFGEIQKYHDNMIERSPVFIKQTICGKKTIFKEHLLPTDRHLRIIEKFNTRFIILLRDVDHSYDSYKRLFEKNNKDFDKKQLYQDILDFHNRWMWWDSRQKNSKIVYYEDLILSYNATMKKILSWYKIKYKKIIPMLKCKYTGVGEKRIKNADNS